MEFIKSIADSLLDAVNSVPSYAWEMTAETVIGAILTSGVFVGIKKWFAIDSERKMVLAVMAGSIFMGALAYLRSVPLFAPWFAFVQGLIIFAVSQPVYFFFIKPLFRRLAIEIQKAMQLNVQLKATKMPAEGSAVEPSQAFAESVPEQDFVS